MKQYLIHAFDHTDSQALERRMAARPAHFEGMKKLKESGNFVVGGAMLNSEGKMMGSMIVFQFESESDLEAWRASEPYITGSVWEKIKIYPFKVAEV